MYINPDRLNYVMDVMNQYAVNGVVDGSNPDYKAAMAKAEELFPTPEITYVQGPKTDTNITGMTIQYNFTQDQLDTYEKNTGGPPKATNYDKFINEETRNDDSVPDYIELGNLPNSTINVVAPTVTPPATTPTPPATTPTAPTGGGPQQSNMDDSTEALPELKKTYINTNYSNTIPFLAKNSSFITIRDRETGQQYTYDNNEGKSGDCLLYTSDAADE